MHKYRETLVLQCLRVPKMTEAEILSLVPVDVLTEIKSKNQHPYFQAFSICHEGTSVPTIIGEANARPIHWFKNAIKSISGKIKKGIKFFLGHNKDNSTNDRESLGEIVADTEKEFDDTLHHIVIGYFPDKEKVKDLDICSQESEWNFFETAGQVVADTIHELTGIALASSKTDRPAFEGAQRLGMVQAFDESGKDSDDKNKRGEEMDLTTVQFNDLLGELKRRNVQPIQVFSLEEIKHDKEFGKTFSDLETAVKTKDEKIKTLETEKETLGKETLKTTAKTRYDKMLGETTMTEKQKSFLKELAVETQADITDEGIKKFIGTKLSEYQAFCKSQGITDELPDQNKGDANKQTSTGEKDYTKKENNPLLTEDYIPE